jgi:hypothetical protein
MKIRPGVFSVAALLSLFSAWSLTSLQQRLVKTGGRQIKHARYYWLELAECHLIRRLFGSMLQRIGALPSPAGWMNHRPNQISVPIETGEENVSQKRVREAQFWALGFSGNRRKG